MINYWSVPKMFNSCWIIGGGPSLKTQFGIPDNVYDPKEVAKYLAPLENRNVIGCNASILLGEKIVDVFYTGDLRFIEDYKVHIKEFTNLKVTDVEEDKLKLREVDDLGLNLLMRNLDEGISNRPKILNWQLNTGMTAINLALLMGAKTIYLLGFDMNVNHNVESHWHQGLPRYENVTTDHNFVRFRKAGSSMKRAISLSYPDVRIINVNPNSELNTFEKMPLNKIL